MSKRSSLLGAMVHAIDPSTEEGKQMIEWLCETTLLGGIGGAWPKPRLVVSNKREEGSEDARE